MSSSRRPTIKDVAAAARVSTATVSYVLNGTGSVSEETADRVRAVVEELGYRANSLAVAHRTGRSGAIGLVIADLSNPFFPAFAQGVHSAAAEHGYAVFLVDSQNSFDDEVKNWEALAERVPEGVIWCPVGKPDHLPDTPVAPVVVFGMELEALDCVNADLHAGGALQAEAAYTRGHRRLALLTGPAWSDAAQLRRSGFVDALPDDAEVRVEFANEFNGEVPDGVLTRILSEGVTCVVTGNDLQAVSLYQACRRRQVSVPGDLSIIGFDDIEVCNLLSPPLSTVHLPKRDLGMTAVDVLVDRINNPDMAPRHDRLGVYLALRESLQTVTPG